MFEILKFVYGRTSRIEENLCYSSVALSLARMPIDSLHANIKAIIAKETSLVSYKEMKMIEMIIFLMEIKIK